MKNPRDNPSALLSPVDCLSYRLRRAARLAAKRYDAALKPAGIRNTQFTLLSALEMQGDITIGALAKALATDSTTLTRNLDVLVRRGLVENIAGEDGRERIVRLTSQGISTYEAALPLWQGAQAHLLAAVSEEAGMSMIASLKEIEIACGELP